MANEIMDLLEKINEMGTTVVMVTHDPELAARASRQIHLLDGRLIDMEAHEVAAPLYNPPQPESSSAPGLRRSPCSPINSRSRSRACSATRCFRPC